MSSMKQMWRRVRERHEDDRGASLVEYALLLGLIAVVCIMAVTFLGRSASSKFSSFGYCWDKAGTGVSMDDCH